MLAMKPRRRIVDCLANMTMEDLAILALCEYVILDIPKILNDQVSQKLENKDYPSKDETK
jgi:hypothetical protein